MPLPAQSTRVELTDVVGMPDWARVRAAVVARLYGVHPTTIHRLATAGKIPKPEKRGGVVSWRLGDIRRDLGA